MKSKTLIIAAAILFSATANSQMISRSSKAVELVNEFCQEKHWRNADLIGYCAKTQMQALSKLDNYLESEWAYESKDLNHPVGRMIKDAFRKGSTVVNGKPWADWTMVRFHFKHSMQEWMKVTGQSTETLNRKL